MKVETIQDPVVFVDLHGNLHDVEINSFDLDIDGNALIIRVDDLNANFADSDEYEGCRSCGLLLKGVRKLKADLELGEGVRVSDARIFRSGSNWQLDMDLNLGAGSHGGKSIVVIFASLSVQDE